MMTYHKPYAEWMQLALDGSLPGDERLRLDEHLAGCQACSDLWAALGQIDGLLAQAPLAAPRAGFTGRFNARLKHRHSQPSAMWGALALGFGAVGAAALILPVGVSALWSLAQLMGHPAASAALWNSASTTSAVMLTVFSALFVSARALGEAALVSPLIWTLALGALIVTLIWIYFMRRLSLQGAGL